MPTRPPCSARTSQPRSRSSATATTTSATSLGSAAAASPLHRQRCINNIKAQGVTQAQNPVGDAFDVDFVAHEIGHQFGGNHTFNRSCPAPATAARSGSAATEVGSGSTIMAYAGICDAENLQPNSHDYFTYESLFELTAYITSGTGCYVRDHLVNREQRAVDFRRLELTIPIGTPFTLTATGSDPQRRFGDLRLGGARFRHRLDLGRGRLDRRRSRPILRWYPPSPARRERSRR